MSVNDYDHDVNRFRLSIGTDRIVIIVHTENPALLSAFKELPEVEEYGYWDHTDSYPEGVTGTDRKIREDVLDGTIPGIRVSDTMDTWVLRDTVEIREELRDVHVMLPHIPEATDRACGASSTTATRTPSPPPAPPCTNRTRTNWRGKADVHQDLQWLPKGAPLAPFPK
ncbi:hypothetical protein [Pseudarthrobacter enclensis]|uniref:Uncharacterized protein n=1 Tax=Pseudarthrobacter enclensis TaxID=993070 RepID=A0ABT9RWE4_9MICC|nr:hypothetical protein [Pseudarthrobacter enclensis]MDP9889558.1 hypothetical protein [Pseudarthrobacter enclensis]